MTAIVSSTVNRVAQTQRNADVSASQDQPIMLVLYRHKLSTIVSVLNLNMQLCQFSDETDILTTPVARFGIVADLIVFITSLLKAV